MNLKEIRLVITKLKALMDIYGVSLNEQREIECMGKLITANGPLLENEPGNLEVYIDKVKVFCLDQNKKITYIKTTVLVDLIHVVEAYLSNKK